MFLGIIVGQKMEGEQPAPKKWVEVRRWAAVVGCAVAGGVTWGAALSFSQFIPSSWILVQ